MSLSMRAFSEANRERCKAYHPDGVASWTPDQWAGAMAGEVGEALNARKKYTQGRVEVAAIHAELADVITYADLCAQSIGTVIYVGNAEGPLSRVADVWRDSKIQAERERVIREWWAEMASYSGVVYERLTKGAICPGHAMEFIKSVITRAMLLIVLYDGDPETVLRAKFNEVSDRVGSPIKL